MDIETRTKIETAVIERLREVFYDDGIMEFIDLRFGEFDFELFEIVAHLIPSDDDDTYDRIIEETDAIAKNQFDYTIAKLTAAITIIDGALNITEK